MKTTTSSRRRLWTACSLLPLSVRQPAVHGTTLGTLILSLLPLIASAETTWSLSKTTAYPGDVITLQATMTRPDFAELEIKLPQIKNLHLITHQQGAVEYKNKTYTQQSTWTFQPTSSGLIEFPEPQASLIQGETILETTLPPLTLTVNSYAETEDDFTPQPLPENKTTQSTTFTKWLIPAIALILLTAFIISKLCKKTLQAEATQTPPDLTDLRKSLETNQDPTPLLTTLLTHPTLKITPPLRAAMERAAYGKSADHASLLKLLTEETAP